jgi:hypothetical protein
LGEPTSAERGVLAAVAAGEEFDLRVGDPEQDDPRHGAAWDEARIVRASFLSGLCVGVFDAGPAHARGLRLRGARISGALSLEAATVAFPLTFRDCSFDEPLVLTEARLVSLRLPGCHVPGINADQLETRGNVDLSDGFRADGEVRLVRAHIGGALDCGGGIFANPGGLALNADGLTVDQSMLCRWGFRADGGVHLRGAHIGGWLSCGGGTFANAGRCALNARGMTVEQDMYCGDGFRADGEFRLIGARIGGRLSCGGAIFSNPDGHTLNGDHMAVGGLLLLLPAAPPQGIVALTHARVGVLVDAQETWPAALRLDGFVYDAIRASPEVTVEQRLDWLERDLDGYSPQKYEQLAGAYRRTGQEQEARAVAIAKQRARRQVLSRPGRLWSRLLGVTVGYGYQPWRALWWLAGFVTVGAVLFANAYPSATTATTPAGQLPVFQPVVYALDVLLPVVDLRQEEFWIPDAAQPWGWLFLGWFWLSIGAGWILTSVVAAAVTGLLRTD